MKKLTLILGVFAAVVTLSCSKESAPGLTGKWRFYANGAKGTGTTIVWEANTDDACEAQSFSQLNADGSTYFENYSINPITDECELADDSLYTSTWVKEGDDLIVTYESGTFVEEYKSRIVSLSSSELITQEYNQAGTALIDSYSKLIRK
jgi:hypothetical protein